jgi:hypothetical protein
VTASLYGFQDERLIPFIAGASIRQRVKWLNIFKNAFVKLDARQRRKKVMKLSLTQLPLICV